MAPSLAMAPNAVRLAPVAPLTGCRLVVSPAIPVGRSVLPPLPCCRIRGSPSQQPFVSLDRESAAFLMAWDVLSAIILRSTFQDDSSVSSSGPSIFSSMCVGLDCWEDPHWRVFSCAGPQPIRCSSIIPGLDTAGGPISRNLGFAALRLRTWTSTYVDSLDIGPQRLRTSIWL